MRVAVPTETAALERRVALVPEVVGKLVKAGVEVVVQAGAGVAARFPDAQYEAAGARIAPTMQAALEGADVVLKVSRPSSDEIAILPAGSILISYLQPVQHPELIAKLAARKITGFAMEYVPRITRAQSMDSLSSQATVTGYKAVLMGASLMGRLLPMLTTAAGTLVPAKAFVLGAGVAGLQAIATARRLGAVVSAFDVRPIVKEQVQSLGAKFIEAETVQGAEVAGGYAKELAADAQEKVRAAIAKAIVEMDLVISTAQIPGKPAPRLIDAAMVATMKPGSVIVDCAAESGGNCELTKPGETIEVNGVTIVGPLNIPASVPSHASQMYAKNVQTLLQHLLVDGAARIDLADEITGAMVVTHAGEICSR